MKLYREKILAQMCHIYHYERIHFKFNNHVIIQNFSTHWNYNFQQINYFIAKINFTLYLKKNPQLTEYTYI